MRPCWSAHAVFSSGRQCQAGSGYYSRSNRELNPSGWKLAANAIRHRFRSVTDQKKRQIRQAFGRGRVKCRPTLQKQSLRFRVKAALGFPPRGQRRVGAAGAGDLTNLYSPTRRRVTAGRAVRTEPGDIVTSAKYADGGVLIPDGGAGRSVWRRDLANRSSGHEGWEWWPRPPAFHAWERSFQCDSPSWAGLTNRGRAIHGRANTDRAQNLYVLGTIPRFMDAIYKGGLDWRDGHRGTLRLQRHTSNPNGSRRARSNFQEVWAACRRRPPALVHAILLQISVPSASHPTLVAERAYETTNRTARRERRAHSSSSDCRLRKEVARVQALSPHRDIVAA